MGGGSALLVEQDVSLKLAHGLGRAEADPGVVELVPLSVGWVEAVPETANRPITSPDQQPGDAKWNAAHGDM